jgi:hypothetical protein
MNDKQNNEIVLLLGLIVCCIFPPAILIIILYGFIEMVAEASKKIEKKGLTNNESMS